MDWLLIPFKDSENLMNVKTSCLYQHSDKEKYFLLIEKHKISEKLSKQETIDILNIQVECCKAVLNRPTFAELEYAIHGVNNVLASKQKKLDETEEKLKILRRSSIDIHEVVELQDIYNSLEISAGAIFPSNTMLALTNIAFGVGISDIQEITKEKLITAYNKARLYKGRPSDYIPGLFTDEDKQDIDDFVEDYISLLLVRRRK